MIVISQQLDYMRSKDLGFEAKQKVILPLRTESTRKNHEILHNELLKVSSIEGCNGYELHAWFLYLDRFQLISGRFRHGEGHHDQK